MIMPDRISEMYWRILLLAIAVILVIACIRLTHKIRQTSNDEDIHQRLSLEGIERLKNLKLPTVKYRRTAQWPDENCLLFQERPMKASATAASLCLAILVLWGRCSREEPPSRPKEAYNVVMPIKSPPL
jgi:hypothetical protein